MSRKTVAYGGGPGVLAWHRDGQRIAIGSQDGSLKIFSVDGVIAETCAYDDNNDPVLALAFHPTSQSLICAINHTVSLCALGPDCTSITVDGFAARSNTDINDLAVSPDSKMLALATEENEIAVVFLQDISQVMMASGHKSPVKCVTFSHDSNWMASAGVDGRVIIWTVGQDGIYHQYESAMMTPTPGTDLRMQLDWNRSRLAVPSKLDVIVLERGSSSWRTVLRLSAGHTSAVSIVRWSPNGCYIASLAADTSGGFEILVWSVPSKKRVGRQHSPDPLISVEWSPRDNSIAILNECGELVIWDEPVPREMQHPCDQTESDLACHEDAEDCSEKAQQAEDEDMDDSGDSMVVDSRKRRRLLRQDSENDEDLDDVDVADTIDDGDDHDSIYSDDRYVRTGLVPRLQSPFQPGSTTDAKDPWMMAWNLFGSIESSAVDDVTRRVQINFADTESRPRIRLTDRLGFNKASLGKFSALFSSPRKGDSVPATIFYKNFDSWAANSDWSATLPEGENVAALTLVGRNVATSSDRGILRLMSHSGLHRSVLCLDHAVVCMAGSVHNQLALIMISPSGSYHYVLYYFDKQIKRLGSGTCPISADCTISWAGYSEEGVVLVMDSSFFVRGLVSVNGNFEWVPYLDGGSHCTTPKTTIWPVGASSTDILVATLRNGVVEPSVTNRPILNGLPFLIPTMLSDAQVVPLEQRCLMNSLVVSHYQSLSDIGTHKQRNERKAACIGLVLKQDVALIEHLRVTIHDNNISRALDLATCLSSEKALNAARKIVETMNQPLLVERLNLLARVMFPKQQQVQVKTSPHLSSASRSTTPGVLSSPKQTSSPPVAIALSPSPANRLEPAVSLPTSSETPSMKPDFRRRPSVLSQSVSRAPSEFASRLDQKRAGGQQSSNSSSQLCRR